MSGLALLPHRLAICRLAANEPVPTWAVGPFVSITRTAEELSVVCAEGVAPAATKFEGGWRIFQVAGPLDFALTGVLAAIATPLANAGLSIFSLATFDTDYVMVKEEDLAKACDALRAARHAVRIPSEG